MTCFKEPTAEELANLEPAAGGEDVGCWSDAVAAVNAGQTVTYSFDDTSFESTLSDVVACGGDQ